MRYAWTMRLRPNCADAYIARHQDLPLDMRATLNRAGYRDYFVSTLETRFSLKRPTVE